MPAPATKRDTAKKKEERSNIRQFNNLTIDYSTEDFIFSIDGHEFRSDDIITLVSIRNSISKFVDYRRSKRNDSIK
jgi:hypothetical protein